MNNLEKELVPPTEAWEMKNLGFNENCFASYYKAGYVLDINEYSNQGKYTFLAPTFSQAFRWFREKKMLGEVRPVDDWNSWSYSVTIEDCMSPFCLAYSNIYPEFKTYEEAELACLRKLIEIVKNNNNDTTRRTLKRY